MDWGSFFAAFAPVFLAELPDKTMVATLVLTGTYRRPFAVWLGAAGAFTVQAGVATLAGGLISRLPSRAVALAAALLFAVGAFILWRTRDESAEAAEAEAAAPRPFAKVMSIAFGTVLIAEFGDLTQLTVAGLAATRPSPVLVFAGGLTALWAVAAIATLAGRRLLGRLPIRLVHTVAAGIFAVLAIVSLLKAI